MILWRARRVITLGLVNFWRNRWMSIAAILIITMTLAMMGVFMILSYFANSASQALKDKVTVQVDFTESASEADIQELQKTLSSRAGIIATYISKEDALADFKSRSDIKQSTRDLISEENNPLPRGLRIRSLELSNLSQIESVVKQPKYEPIIYSFSYDDNKLLIERIDNGTKFIKEMAAYLTLAFVIVAVFVTLNTVQMAIFARRDEIEIMRLVGASRAYVKIPFYVESALFGLIAALLSFLLIYLGVRYSAGLGQVYLSGLDLDSVNIFHKYYWQIIASQLGLGVLLGIICSEVSIRRYIKI